MGCIGSKEASSSPSSPAAKPSKPTARSASAADSAPAKSSSAAPPKANDNNEEEVPKAEAPETDDIFEKFEFKEELGRGAFSIVKLAINKYSADKVAVKVIDKTKMSDQYKKNLQMETDILKKVKHDNIIQLLEIYETDEYLFLVMELVTGGELFDKIVEKGCYTENEASTLVRKIVSAIGYLHDLDICHRDLKPENLLLSNPNASTEVKIADFGLSKIINQKVMMQTACGTPGYVAPEVLSATGYDKEVDMWSIGVITYILLCGFPPFFGDTVPELFEQIMNAEYDYPEDYWSEVSEEAKAFIDALLVVDPQKRMTAAQALAHPWLNNVQSEKELQVGTKMGEYVVDHRKDVGATITKDELAF